MKALGSIPCINNKKKQVSQWDDGSRNPTCYKILHTHKMQKEEVRLTHLGGWLPLPTRGFLWAGLHGNKRHQEGLTLWMK
jgi:hypothetical protein